MKCIILTIAYNAEKTIARTIESVLAQTGADWTYYLVDNGSEDATYEICCRYAKEHGNIVVWREAENDVWAVFKYIRLLLLERPDAEGLCTVDADDALTPEFLCTAVSAMEKYQADLVILGTQFINAADNTAGGGHIVPSEKVVSHRNFGELFPQVHWFLRQLWCKLYRASVLRSYDVSDVKRFVHGGDTAAILQFLRHADKVILVPVYGYRYYISPTSMSYWFAEGRYHADQYLFQEPLALLEQKVGYVSEGNREFMLKVYYHSMEDTLKVAVKADAAPQKKLMELYGTYCNPVTEELFRKDAAFLEQEDWKHQINAPAAGCIVTGADAYTEEDIGKAAAIFAQMNGQFAQIIPEGCLQRMMAEAPKVVEGVALCRYQDAFQALWELFRDGELSCCECSLSLGQALSGALSLETEYEMFSKLLIEWYMENGKMGCARKELSDWLFIRPDDAEFIRLKEKLMGMPEDG